MKKPGLVDLLVPLAVYAVIGLLLVAIACSLQWASCSARWENSGMHSKWGPIAGCRVQRGNGTWIPSENLRDMDPKAREARP